MDELTHLDDSLADVAFLLGLHERNSGTTAAAPDGAVPQTPPGEHKGD
jgi:hypothetical protein